MSRFIRLELKYHVSEAVEHDLIEIIEIEEECLLSPWGWDAYNAELSLPGAILLVVRNRQQVPSDRCLLGFLAARVVTGEFHLNNIGVREHSRRFGVGSALLEEALERAGTVGARTGFLEVRAGNLIAQEFYQRFGFRASGRRRRYYQHPSEDALVMKRHF